ncbi:AMP-dependent synthetase and ligase [Calothrix sp. NIES-4071]|nr:AMP-dependent synthetase and ligase [Calothrix sp. NIES-4071]BAZ56329.1 AMP-dependent synthetase and ligase [Calothrix sp. NIES-4105]
MTLMPNQEVVLTYTQLNQKIQCFAAGLQALGVAPGDRSERAELFIIQNSGSTGLVLENLKTANLMHQVNSLGAVVAPQVGHIILSILPTWHSYERSCEYYLLSQGCTQIYTNLRSAKAIDSEGVRKIPLY